MVQNLIFSCQSPMKLKFLALPSICISNLKICNLGKWIWFAVNGNNRIWKMLTLTMNRQRLNQLYTFIVNNAATVLQICFS